MNNRLLLQIILGCVLMTAAACSRASKAESSAPVDPEPAAAGFDSDPDFIKLDHLDQFARVRVEVRDVVDEWSVNGIVAPDVSRTVAVLSMAGGRTMEIFARVGDDVRKDQILARLQSADLASALADYRKFRADQSLAQRELERSQRLYQEKAIAQRDLQQAEDTLQKANVDVETNERRIRIMGGDPTEPSPVIDVSAPISGTIIEQNIANGTNVRSIDNSPNLFTIADLSHVWLLCDVYENNLGRIHVGDFAEVRLNAYPEQPIKGRVGQISKILDPVTRSAKVRLELDNPKGLLRPNMFAVVKFVTQGVQTRMVLPAAAMMRLHDKDWVFLYQNEKGFRRVMVTPGTVMTDQYQQILSGLMPGDEVAANALQVSAAAGQGAAP